MGYVHTTKSIQKVKPYLDAMVKAQGTLTWASNEPKKLAYQLHNGLAAAEVLNFAPYDKLRSKYRISYTHGKVIAQLRAIVAIKEGELNFDGVYDPFEIVQTIIKHKELDFTLFFPMQFVDPETVELVKAYTDTNNYELEILETGIRILKRAHNGDIQSASS